MLPSLIDAPIVASPLPRERVLAVEADQDDRLPALNFPRPRNTLFSKTWSTSFSKENIDKQQSGAIFEFSSLHMSCSETEVRLEDGNDAAVLRSPHLRTFQNVAHPLYLSRKRSQYVVVKISKPDSSRGARNCKSPPAETPCPGSKGCPSTWSCRRRSRGQIHLQSC